MKSVSRLHCIGVGLLLVAVGGYGPAAAQQPAPKPHVNAPPPKPKTHVANATKPAKPVKAGIPKSFKGIAAKLNTTPQALETQFEAARAANPKLTHGQFVAANVLAHNLGPTHPDITVQAILDGLKNGNSIGQTLQGFKLSAKDAKEAEEAAEREIKEADKAAKKAEKLEKPEKPVKPEKKPEKP